MSETQVDHPLSDAIFRTIVDHAPIYVMMVDDDDRVFYANDAVVSGFRFTSREALIGQSAAILVAPADRPTVEMNLRFIREAKGRAVRMKRQWVRQDGAIRLVELLARNVDAGGRDVIVAIAQDVTEREEARARLGEVDRMVAMGMIAAAVGHEINNPLAYITANVDFVASSLRTLETGASAEAVREMLSMLEDVRDGASRIAAVVRDLRSFTRADEAAIEPVAIARVVEWAAKMAHNEIRHRARLEVDLEGAPDVLGNEAKLGQVFLNLLVNAAHAIPAGGATRNLIRLSARVATETSALEVHVRDTGGGISPDVLPRIFDPFFTTKPFGEGTGLGLAITRSIVRGLGGDVEVRSTSSAGTLFVVTLPLAPSDATRGSRRRTVAWPPRMARLLVVEDEPLLARALRRMLAPLTVVIASDGNRALELLAHDAAFDLVVADVMMPDLGAAELYGELSRQHSPLADRMVFLSGGAFCRVSRDFVSRQEHRVLAKPFTIDEVREFVARHLVDRS